MGTAIVPATATHAQTTGYFNYITQMMSAIPASQRTACIWYNANRNTPGINTIGYDPTTSTYIGSADYRVPLLQALWNALTTTAAGGITVTYSTNTSGQAAVVVGDDNVQSGDDVHTGATGSGTTPSVATGTLAQAEEHIIAFFGNLNAGGTLTLGDGLTAASAGQTAGSGGPKIKAGFKTAPPRPATRRARLSPRQAGLSRSSRTSSTSRSYRTRRALLSSASHSLSPPQPRGALAHSPGVRAAHCRPASPGQARESRRHSNDRWRLPLSAHRYRLSRASGHDQRLSDGHTARTAPSHGYRAANAP